MPMVETNKIAPNTEHSDTNESKHIGNKALSGLILVQLTIVIDLIVIRVFYVVVPSVLPLL